MENKDNDKIIEPLLKKGIKNAIKLKTLKTFFPGVCDRILLAQIERERRQGIPILASKAKDNAGYYLPEDNKDIEEYLRLLEASIKSQKEIYNAIEAFKDNKTANAQN